MVFRKEHREKVQFLIGGVALSMDLDHDTHVFLWISSRPIEEAPLLAIKGSDIVVFLQSFWPGS